MFRVDTNITIGEYEFAYCVDVEIDNSRDSLTDTCKITLPRKFEWNMKNIALGDDPILKRKDKVIVKAGYDGLLLTEFIGYVKDIKSGVPVTIECEDSMFLLKQSGAEVTKSYRSVTLHQLLTDILPAGIEFKAPGIVLGPYRISKVTPAKVLEDLKSRFNIYSYFRLIDEKPVLYSGLAYWSEKRVMEDFQFGYNIIDHSDLVYKREEDVRLRVKAIGIMPDNTRKEIEVGDRDGETRTVHYYNVDLKTLKLRADQDLARFKYTGYYGSFLTFGVPSVQKGDIANLTGNQYNPDGRYLVKRVIKQIGVTRGFKQTIEPESIVNDKRNSNALI
ncbi:MAG: hypothetical protein ACT4OJ_01280 [Bacteroidota bacterium]